MCFLRKVIFQQDVASISIKNNRLYFDMYQNISGSNEKKNCDAYAHLDFLGGPLPQSLPTSLARLHPPNLCDKILLRINKYYLSYFSSPNLHLSAFELFPFVELNRHKIHGKKKFKLCKRALQVKITTQVLVSNASSTIGGQFLSSPQLGSQS